MATLSVSSTGITSNGLNMADDVAAAGGGDEFVNDGRTVFWAKNASGGSITIIFATPNTISSAALAVSNLDITVAAGEERVIGPFPVRHFNDSNSKVQVALVFLARGEIVAVVCEGVFFHVLFPASSRRWGVGRLSLSDVPRRTTRAHVGRQRGARAKPHRARRVGEAVGTQHV